MSRAETDDQSQSAGHYTALSESAVSFLERHGGSVHEDALVSHVFGKSASPALWRSLLQSALADEWRLSYTADGRWILIGGPTDGSLMTESLLPRFVAIDVETTGLKPTSQRVIEVALIRYEHGVETARFDKMVNPQRRIPDYISKITGIRDDDVEDAAVFGDLAAEIVEFIGNDPLIGHNVSFDIGFVNAELQRVHIGRLINESVDTLALATRLIAGLRRPSLDRVAKAVGLTPRKIHRAGIDAEMTAEVALRLEAEARRQGINSFDALKVVANVRERRRGDKVGRGRSLVDRSLLEGIPRKPGVYLMRDGDGQAIYVGKAKNLRERVGTYFSQPLGYARKMDGLLEAISRIDTEVTGSELEALLLEAQLIRRYAPRYNTAMRSFEHYPFIRVDVSNRWPRITLVRDRKDDGARYFGPYRSRSSAKRAVDVINDVMPLRTCTRSFKNARSYGNPCMRLALGKCLGPCVDLSIGDEYRGMVHQVIRFLDGDDDALYTVLWEALENAAERQDFERAEKLRRNLTVVNGIVAGQRQLRQAVERHHLLLAVPSMHEGERELWLVLEGRVWSRMSVPHMPVPEGQVGQVTDASEGPTAEQDDAVLAITHVGPAPDHSAFHEAEHNVQRLMRSYQRYQRVGIPAVSHDSLDDAHILNRWIAGNSQHPAVTVLDQMRVNDAEYWRAIHDWALRIPSEQLVLEVTGSAGAEQPVAGDSASAP